MSTTYDEGHITITMTEVATYKETFTPEQVAHLLDLPADTPAATLVGILNGEPPEGFTEAWEEPSGTMADTLVKSFSHVDDREFSAEVTG